MADEPTSAATNSIELATELTIAWLSNPNVRPSTDDALAFLRSMRGEIEGMANLPQASAADAQPKHVPAMPVRSSIKPDYLVSLIDGRKLKTLARHLATHGLTPTEYRQRYGLKPDYPMVAANYSAERRAVALKRGLGQKGRAVHAKVMPEPVAGKAPAPALAPVKRGRPKKRAPAAS